MPVVIDSYFLFKCSCQNNSWQLYACPPVLLFLRLCVSPQMLLFLRLWFCEIWKSWLKQNQGIGGDYLSNILYIVTLGLRYILPNKGCILILTTAEFNVVKFYMKTFKEQFRLFSIQTGCLKLFKAVFPNQNLERKLVNYGGSLGVLL